MSEKSFKDNPALQFISGAGEETAETQKTDGSKKTDPQSQKGGGAEKRPPEGYKIDPQYVEKKTRRLQLVLQPSLYKKVQKEAKRQKLSVNEYVHRVLEKATEGK